MSTPYLSEIKICAFNFAPRGWALCNGQILPINQNQALFALLGTTYGGNGQTTFALPNLQGRAPMHAGGGFVLGQSAGEETHTLIAGEMPAHTHVLSGTAVTGKSAAPAGNTLAAARGAYGETANAQLLATTIAPAGGNQPHENRPPFLVLNFVIALQGIFPSPN
jgi:microcystin-dependent protein